MAKLYIDLNPEERSTINFMNAVTQEKVSRKYLVRDEGFLCTSSGGARRFSSNDILSVFLCIFTEYNHFPKSIFVQKC